MNTNLQHALTTLYASLNEHHKEFSLGDWETLHKELEYVINMTRDQINQKLLEATTDETH